MVGRTKFDKRKRRRNFLKNKMLLSDNVVVNLSKCKLTLNEIKVLNKGLGFVPSHFRPDFATVDADVKRFERKLQLHLFFINDRSEFSDQNVPLQKNPDWWPPRLNGHITHFCYNLRNLCCRFIKTKCSLNLTRSELAALRALKTNKSIVIKKCDKGGGIAVMDTDFYLSRIRTMLNDTVTYSSVAFNDIDSVKVNADKLICDLFEKGFLNRKQKKHLTNFTPRTPVFYGLPKVHKPDTPLRPIVSQIDSATCKINELVDKYLTVAEKHIPFLLQDTTAYLRLLDKHKNVPSGTFLVTADVGSLYTNIPHREGVEWVSQFYEETLCYWHELDFELLPVDRETLATLMRFILDNCTFEFAGELFKQNFGTTMGAKFSVKFANIYMHMWFRTFLKDFHGVKPSFVARLIDDCFFIWTYGESDLKVFLDFLNTRHASIKFEFKYSTESVTFLDTVTYVDNRIVKTNVYIKPTDRKQYLYFTSSHPRHIFRSIPFSQALRYRRIIVDEERLTHELNDLKMKFVRRGYPTTLLDRSFAKALSVERTTLLKYKTKEEKRLKFESFLKGRSFLPFITVFHKSLSCVEFRQCFETEWHKFVDSCDDIRNVFSGELPQIVFKRGRTIANVLTSTRFVQFFDEQDHENINILLSLLNENECTSAHSVRRCDMPTCKCCKHLYTGSHYYSSDGKTKFPIKENFNCSSRDVIYVISCTKCHVLYVGQTSMMLKERLNNHRSDIKLRKSTAVAKHFNEPNHSILNLKIMPVDSLAHLPIFRKLDIEQNYMRLLNTKYPKGLNNYPLLN